MSLYRSGKVFTKEEIEELKQKTRGMFTIEQDYARTTGIKGDETLQELLKKFGYPCLGGESAFEVIDKYGYTVCGICDSFEWKDTVKDISELEAWKIIALSSIYWWKSYKNWLDRERSDNGRSD